MLLRWVMVVLAGGVASGCTRGVVDSPPTAPSPALTALTITPIGGGSLLVGSSVPLATSGTLPPNAMALGAFAQYANDSGHYVEARWTSSDDSVIVVDAGRLVARGRGSVTLTATYEGLSDTETFIAEGGVAGRWQGSYVVQECSGNSGSVQEVLCNPPGNRRAPGLAAVGSMIPLSLDISENGGELTAAVSLGVLRGTLTGQNRGGGYFFLHGPIAAGGVAINVVRWETQVVRDTMEGFIAYEIRLPNLPGYGGVVAKLVDMNRQ
jgi:hypothetical protein